MAITDAAYLRVGLGMIPEDTQAEMMEKREDTTSQWRLPPPSERGTAALSESEAAAIGLAPHLSTEVTPQRGLEEWDWQPDPSSLARNPLFKWFAQVMEQIEQYIGEDADFSHLVGELASMEEGIDEVSYESAQERDFVLSKISEALTMLEKRFRLARGGVKMKRQRIAKKDRMMHPGDTKRANRKSMMRHRRTKSHDKMMRKTAKQGFRREDMEGGIASVPGYTGRMEGISDNPHDRDEQRRLAGITESSHSAFSSSGIMDARRPQHIAEEVAPTDELESFRHLMGFRR